MDILDIMLARALTPQGQVDTYAAKAQRAAQNAEAANTSAQNSALALENAAQTKADAEAALEDVQAALTALEQVDSLVDLNTVDNEIKKMTVVSAPTSDTTASNVRIQVQYPDSTGHTDTLLRMYKATGANEDGTMTQKAITNALSTKVEISTLNNYATTAYVNSVISSGGGTGGGGISNLGAANSGKIVVVGNDGNIAPGTILESALIEALLSSGGYTARNAVGLEIDYDNKSVSRTQQATGLSMGSDFDEYTMYGGRRRCNVADDGTITAFYGDAAYKEDGSNGQVMVYQPKFYYQRVPLSLTSNKVGKTIMRDSLIVSYTSQNGFKLHPLFRTPTGEELDYVLLSAYEGGVYDTSASSYITTTATNVDFNADKMTSVAGSKPITGSSGLTLQRAEQLANNRGTGWHIYNILAESADQILETIEFGSMNGQAALGKGISYIATNGTKNQSALSGSTASLGNASGSATTTTFELDGSTFTETENGKVAISYRGVENPWGNVWHMLNGIIVSGTGASNGGIPYICTDYNYSYSGVGSSYTSAGFSLPNTSSWISALGYSEGEYDWLLMPSDCAASANSILPIGDNGWFDPNLNGLRIVVQGGSWVFEESNGPFYYGCDKQPQDSSYKSYGARLLYIPTKNAIYSGNIAKWEQEMNKGG